jgi:hypothetical protein
MTIPTDQELTRLRQRPHRTRLHLSVYQPNTVLAAQINMPTISRGERAITIDILGGYHPAVTRGQTCYIGTTPGGRDVGRLRAISASSVILTVAENDKTLLDGMYLTVVQYFEPWAVFPRIVLDGNNVPTFYKDYDILYVDQNEQMDPVICMGPNHAMFLEVTPSGTYANAWYSSSGTYDPSDGSTPTGYAWTFEGATQTGSNIPDPGYRTYTGAGHFLTSLEVTTNFGKTFTGRRHVSVYTRPDEGPAMPIVSWGLAAFDGSREQGGYSLRFWVRENADYEKIIEGGLVVIYSDDGEGPFEGKAGGNAENRSKIVYVGYIEDDSISLNPITSRLEFRSSSITGTMKRLASFSATLENVADALTWNEMTNMVVDKAMIHYMRWHSTIMAIADFSPTGDDIPVEFMDFERTSVYDAVNNLYGSALLATAVADRQGKIWAEVEANVRPTGSRGLDTVLSVTRQDWRTELGIEVRRDEVLSYLELGGIAYAGVETGTSEPYLSGAPGDAPAYFGSLERLSGMVIRSQTQLNEISGLAFASRNANYPEVTMPMAGEYRIMDIAPQERVLVSLDVDDTYRRISWDEKEFIPREIMYQYDAADQMLLMDVTLGEETEGPPGETVIIPVVPPFNVLDVPEIELPPIPIPPEIPLPPIDPVPGTGDVVYVVVAGAITRTRNFFDANPTWDVVATIAELGTSGGFLNFKLDNLDPENTAWATTQSGEIRPYYAYKITNLNSDSPVATCIMTGQQWFDIQPAPKNDQATIYDIDVSVVDGSIYLLGHRQSLGAPSVGVVRDVGAGWEHNFVGSEWSSQTRNQIVWPSDHNAARVFSGFGRETFRSQNKGVSWTILNPGDDFNGGYYIPYQGNSNDLAIYAGYEFGGTKALWYSEDGGATYDDFSPNVLGNLWGIRRSGTNGSWRQRMTALQGNRLVLLFVMAKKVAEPGDAAEALFISSSGPGGLYPALLLTGNAWSPQIHKTNASKMYVIAGLEADGGPLGSQDFGVTWVSKLASWEADTGLNWSSSGARVILPVWTI